MGGSADEAAMIYHRPLPCPPSPSMTRTLLAVALLAVLVPVQAATSRADLTTESERSGFVRTGRYSEVIALCDAFAKAYPDAVRCIDFGTTPEGRPMKALIVSRSGALTPEAARAKGLPVLLVQGGIHAGEIDGKDAGFQALREMLDGTQAKGALEKQVLIFVPVFNVDGHERFGAWNRPNQRGPEQMGWRTTAQNYNLTLDYAKLDTPEMRAMLAMVDAWDPIAYIDLHVTDGAKFQQDIAIQVEPIYSGDPELRVAGRAFRDAVIADVTRDGAMPVAFYPSFVENDNPASGFADGVSPPRFSTGYFPLRNRFAMLVETHSWRDYPHRVKTTHDTVLSVVRQVAEHGRDWKRIADAADAKSLAGQSVPLDYAPTDKARTIDFLGYAYTRTPSDVSGGTMTHYDETRPEVWHLPLRDDVQPSRTAVAPRAGYIVPAAQAAWVGEKLQVHGIRFEVIDHALDKRDVQVFRATSTKFGSSPNEGHQRLEVEGTWTPEARNIPAGSLFVPIAQPEARLVIALFEPQAPDAFAAWGMFNPAFEQKEYMEAYVAEAVAREMLAKDPAMRAEFEAKLKDPAFAKSPEARLAFFARKAPSWDERLNLYPVMRTDTMP
jgi:hypothetical protein